jgi:hypothetical protein
MKSSARAVFLKGLFFVAYYLIFFPRFLGGFFRLAKKNINAASGKKVRRTLLEGAVVGSPTYVKSYATNEAILGH